MAAAVYMAVMGPQGFKELGEGILERVAYAREELAKIPGIKLYGDGISYSDFLIDFNETGKTVKEINKALLDYKIIGGAEFIEQVVKAFGEVGEGNLNWPEIIAACRETEARACIVEQDNCYGKNPFDCLKLSVDNMAKFGL